MSQVFPINADPRFRISTAVGGETSFSVPFPFQDNDDIEIWRFADADDVVGSKLLEGVHYSLTGASSTSGGTVSLVTAATAGQRYLRVGRAVIDRVLSVVREGRFKSQAIDEDIDRFIIIAQELARDVGQAPRYPLGATRPAEGQLLALNANGELVGVNPQGVAFRGAWQDSPVSYLTNDITDYNGSLWRARVPNSGQAPAEGVYWTIFIPGSTTADGSVGEAKLGPKAVTNPKLGDGSVDGRVLSSTVRIASLVNAMRAKAGTGTVLDGRGYVDLLFDRRTIDVVNSENWAFVLGGIGPTTTEGTPTVAASATLSSDNGGWLNNTIGIKIAAASISGTGSRVRVRFNAASAENLYIRGAVIGHAQENGSIEFDRAKEPVPLRFNDTVDWWQEDITLNTSVWAYADFELEAGRDVLIFFYVANDSAKDGLRYVASATGWTGHYKAASNEASKYAKTGYSTAGVFAIDRLEIVPVEPDDVDVISEELDCLAAPGSADLVVLADAASGDLGDLTVSLSRDGSTWLPVSLSADIEVDGQWVLTAGDVDLSSGAGSGTSLYWRAETANGKDIKIAAVGLALVDTAFGATPSIRIEKKATTVSHHLEKTGLGYDDAGNLRYGRLWGFTQDFEVEGPTRFHVNFCAQLEMTSTAFPDPETHPITTTPVMFIVVPTIKYAVDAATMGDKPLVVTDYVGLFGGRAENWCAPSSGGNIAGTREHYKDARIVTTVDVLVPGVYRFEIWGYSETDADPGVPGRIVVQHTDSFIAPLRKLVTNELAITPEVLR